MYDTGTGSNLLEGVVKAYPGSAFTYTVLMTSPLIYSNYTQAGFVIANTLTTQAMIFDIVYNSGWFAAVAEMSTPTTFVTTASTQNIVQSGQYWLRLQDDGTNIKFSFSADGVYFYPFYSVAKSSSYLGSSGFNYLGLFIEPQNVNTGVSFMSIGQTNP
jgi:hypothetical protein